MPLGIKRPTSEEKGNVKMVHGTQYVQPGFIKTEGDIKLKAQFDIPCVNEPYQYML